MDMSQRNAILCAAGLWGFSGNVKRGRMDFTRSFQGSAHHGVRVQWSKSHPRSSQAKREGACVNDGFLHFPFKATWALIQWDSPTQIQSGERFSRIHVKEFLIISHTLLILVELTIKIIHHPPFYNTILSKALILWVLML